MVGNKRLALVKRRWGFPYQGKLLSPANAKLGLAFQKTLCATLPKFQINSANRLELLSKLRLLGNGFFFYVTKMFALQEL